MFLVKGGTVDVLLAANDAAGPIEREPITLDGAAPAARVHAASGSWPAAAGCSGAIWRSGCC